MIIAVGVDIVDISRIDALKKNFGMRFLSRIFTPEEIAYCTARHDTAASLAGRFAAKEAAFKAPPRVSLGVNPRDRAADLGTDGNHLSISHDRGCAVAVVILEGS